MNLRISLRWVQAAGAWRRLFKWRSSLFQWPSILHGLLWARWWGFFFPPKNWNFLCYKSFWRTVVHDVSQLVIFFIYVLHPQVL